jgi:hypothetical protein
MKVVDVATGWSFECPTTAGGDALPGGLVLQGVTNDGHNFAKDIRLIGLWLNVEQVDPSGKVVSLPPKLYILDSPTFTGSAVKRLTPSPMFNPTLGKTFDYLKEADAALDFTTYFKDPKGNYVATGVSSTFDAPTLLNSLPNCEYGGLQVMQIFLLSHYSDFPVHEPSGQLKAARCHPLTRYALSPNPSFDPKKPFTRVRSIRFDYRLHLFLDRHHDVATNAGKPQLGNQAGLFADSDSKAGSVVVGFGSGVWNVFKPNTSATARSRGAFDAVEKPVVLEVTAPGLGKGFSNFKVTPKGGGTPIDVRAWDNVHWWGARGAGNPLISAPGAFHCAHMHWRWGAAVTLGGSVGTDPHFHPNTYPTGVSNSGGIWGPLVDPAIWIQTIRVALVKNDPKLDPAKAPLTSLTKEDWSSLFDPGLRVAPDDIMNGDDIVLWYAAEVHRDLSDPSAASGSQLANPKVPALGSYTSRGGGTVFLHGIFFAHDAEKPGAGSTDPAHRPTDEATIRAGKNWVRTAG